MAQGIPDVSVAFDRPQNWPAINPPNYPHPEFPQVEALGRLYNALGGWHKVADSLRLGLKIGGRSSGDGGSSTRTDEQRAADFWMKARIAQYEHDMKESFMEAQMKADNPGQFSEMTEKFNKEWYEKAQVIFNEMQPRLHPYDAAETDVALFSVWSGNALNNKETGIAGTANAFSGYATHILETSETNAVLEQIRLGNYGAVLGFNRAVESAAISLPFQNPLDRQTWVFERQKKFWETVAKAVPQDVLLSALESADQLNDYNSIEFMRNRFGDVTGTDVNFNNSLSKAIDQAINDTQRAPNPRDIVDERIGPYGFKLKPGPILNWFRENEDRLDEYNLEFSDKDTKTVIGFTGTQSGRVVSESEGTIYRESPVGEALVTNVPSATFQQQLFTEAGGADRTEFEKFQFKMMIDGLSTRPVTPDSIALLEQHVTWGLQNGFLSDDEAKNAILNFRQPLSSGEQDEQTLQYLRGEYARIHFSGDFEQAANYEAEVDQAYRNRLITNTSREEFLKPPETKLTQEQKDILSDFERGITRSMGVVSNNINPEDRIRIGKYLSQAAAKISTMEIEAAAKWLKSFQLDLIEEGNLHPSWGPFINDGDFDLKRLISDSEYEFEFYKALTTPMRDGRPIPFKTDTIRELRDLSQLWRTWIRIQRQYQNAQRN